MNMTRSLSFIATLFLAGCGAGDNSGDSQTGTFIIGGAIIGLSGIGLVLQNNGADDLPVSPDQALTVGGQSLTNFTFGRRMNNGSRFDATVLASPTNPNQTCTVNNGAGMVNNSHVTNITLTCLATTNTGTLKPGEEAKRVVASALEAISMAETATAMAGISDGIGSGSMYGQAPAAMKPAQAQAPDFTSCLSSSFDSQTSKTTVTFNDCSLFEGSSVKGSMSNWTFQEHPTDPLRRGFSMDNLTFRTSKFVSAMSGSGTAYDTWCSYSPESGPGGEPCSRDWVSKDILLASYTFSFEDLVLKVKNTTSMDINSSTYVIPSRTGTGIDPSAGRRNEFTITLNTGNDTVKMQTIDPIRTFQNVKYGSISITSKKYFAKLVYSEKGTQFLYDGNKDAVFEESISM